MSKSKTSDSPISGPLTFLDTQWKSRTLISPQGAVLQVENGQLTIDDPACIQYLQQHPDFVPQE